MQIIECSQLACVAVCTQWIQCEICILTLFSRTCFSKTTCCNNAVWPTFACTQHCLDTMSMLLGTQLGLVHFHFLIQKIVLPLSILSPRCRMQESVWLERPSTNWTSLVTVSSPLMMFEESTMSRCISWYISPGFIWFTSS